MTIDKKFALMVNPFILLLITLFSSNSSYCQNLKKITLKEVLSIGSVDSDKLYQWADVCTDDSGNIYLTDMMDYSIKKFNKIGVFIKKTGRRGMGPGEFNAIRLIRYYKNYLYVTEQYKPGIKIFNKELQYQYSIPYKKPITDFHIFSSNKISISDVIQGNIQIIDSLGNLKEIFKYKNDQKKSDLSGLFPNMIKFKFDKYKNLYLCYLTKDEIKKCNSKGISLWSEKLFKGKKQQYKNIQGIKTPEFFYYKDIELDTLYNIFILGGNISKNKSRDIYVFSKVGKHLTTFTLPHDTHCIYIDKKNYLYSRAKQGVILKKYKMIYD